MHLWSTIRRIRIVRVEVGHPRSPRPQLLSRRTLPCPRHAPLAAAMIALLSVSATPALAATTGSSTATINVAPEVLSLSVSPATATFANCGEDGTATELSFPNGTCDVGSGAGGASDDLVTGGITITNTGVAGDIDVNGADAIPSDGGTPWTLVPSTTTPGENEFTLWTAWQYSTNLSTTPACDEAFNAPDAGCGATTGQSTEEEIELRGPSSSTDTSSVFTTVISWTAVPSS
jgi:hypothetical protein